MIKKLIIILQMIKFSHSIFALPFALIATFLAGTGIEPGFPSWGKLGLIVWCMVSARSAAMTFNRLVDAKIDARNPRTANRAIPAGQISPKQAWLFLIITSLAFILGAWLFYKPVFGLFGYGNYWPALLVIPFLIFICLYSFTKRFTWASHFWLGTSLMLAPVGAWIAIAPPAGPVISPLPIILGLGVLLWTAGFDIIYACQDIESDQRDKLYSIPSRLGVPLALWISRFCHSLSVTCFLILGLKAQLDLAWLIAVSVTAVLLIAEHILVRQGKMTHIKIAFGTINGIISLMLAAAAIFDIMTATP